MTGIRSAVLLAAGQGSRLRSAAPLKPLCRIGGKALVDHAIERLDAAGIEETIVVTGYGADAIEAHLAAATRPMAVRTVRSPDWRRPNGVSALAAAEALGGRPALLAMCDHLAEPALYRRLAEAGEGEGLRLGIDRRLGHPWIDPEDVTCVRTQGDRIAAIGKGLEPHDAYDCGVFAVGPAFFAALEALDDPSVSAAVQRLADEGKAGIVDCSDLAWIDVDDEAALGRAESWLAQGVQA